MTVSSLRTLVVADYQARHLYGRAVSPIAMRWPTKLPLENLDYSLDLWTRGGPLSDVSDSIASATLSVAPSGEGELQPVDMAVQGAVVTAQLSGGVAGRCYEVQVVVTAVSGRVFQFLVNLPVSAATATYPPPTPPDTGFGVPITWTSGVTVFGPSFVAVATGLTATGTDQASAAPLTAQTNIVTTVPTGAGMILPGGIVSGTMVITNASANDLLVYPPDGAQIGSYAVNAPVAISPGQTVSFSTQSPTTEWFAA
jgi:hypothetical protein